MNTTTLKNRLNRKLETITIEKEKEIMSEAVITTTNQGYVALNNNTIDIIKENLKN